MIFHELPIAGAKRLDLDRKGDDRGFFARMFCRQEFAEHGLCPEIAQANTSQSVYRGTVRGLHYQLPPYGEDKTVRCIAGAIYDVILDVRPDSPTFGHWYGEELSAENRRMLHVPVGCAHGFQALTDYAEIIYLVSQAYAPQAERGVRWDDPAFQIAWPLTPTVISDKDAGYPDWNRAHHWPEGTPSR